MLLNLLVHGNEGEVDSRQVVIVVAITVVGMIDSLLSSLRLGILLVLLVV